MPSLWPAHSSSGIHKDTEASAGSVAVHGYLGFDLQRRHVITPPREQGAVENLCSRGRSSGRDGLSGEKREAFPGTVLGSLTMTLSLPQPKATIIVDTFFPPFFSLWKPTITSLLKGVGQ